MSHSVFIDRIEGGVAVMTTDAGKPFQLPKALLPAGMGEGRWLTMSFAPDPAKDAAMAGKAAALRGKLSADDDGGDLSL
jgi:hypothetical protein